MRTTRTLAAGTLFLAGLSACSADAPTVARPKPVAIAAAAIAPPAACPSVLPYRPVLDMASRLRSRIKLERVGHPVWRPVDFHVISAPLGNAADDYVEEFTTLTTLFPPPKHQLHDVLGVGPGAPHCPPYDQEQAIGTANAHYSQGPTFTPAQFAAPGAGIWVNFMLIPNPGTSGSSPDFGQGAVIANGLFPMEFTFTVEKDGTMFDPGFATDIPPLNSQTLSPRWNVDGASHIPIFLGESDEFAPAGTTNIKGRYVTRIQLLDSGGNGWTIVARYNIKAGAQGR